MEINQKNLKQSLALIKEIAENKRQQGYYFEKLVKTCLKKIPPYSDRFSQVDLWQDCEVRDGQDIGIDLVAKERDSGKLCAIQCKFYDPKTTLQKSERFLVAHFWRKEKINPLQVFFFADTF